MTQACLVNMAYVLHKKVAVTRTIAMPTTVTRVFAAAKVNVIKTICLFLAIILLSWSTIIWVFVLEFFSVISDKFYASWKYHVGVLLIFLSCSINPFVYAIKYKKFKSGVTSLFTRCRSRKIGLSDVVD